MACLFERALAIRDSSLRARRAELRQERQEHYPELLQRMWDTQIENDYQPVVIEWPDYGGLGDPLWRVFSHQSEFSDPYSALLAAIDQEAYQAARAAGTEAEWLQHWRWRGKRCWLALGYGSSTANLAPQLQWSTDETENLNRTRQAIASLKATYATLEPLQALVLQELVHTGEVRTLWNRPYRVNGYYQLARPNRLLVRFWRKKPTPRTYEAFIIPLGTFRQGVQCLVENCWYLNADGSRGRSVLISNEDGTVQHADMLDVFVRAEHFNVIPFRNIAFRSLIWVQELDTGLIRYLPRQESALRKAFNALCQATGADHLRWIMNNIDAEVCSLPGFNDCNLVLCIHDSLVFEVPDEKIVDFIVAIVPVARRRPQWATIDFEVDVTVGQRFGEMENVEV